MGVGLSSRGMRALPALTLFTALLLGGCSTFQGLKEDLSHSYDAVTDTFAKAIDPVKEEKKKLPVYDGTCPPVSIRPDLKNLVEFYNPEKPSDATRISEVTISNVQNTCRVEAQGIIMQIDITLQGRTGPKARMQPTDKPSFAYPYFVAVTDEQGNIVSKEIFATTIAYGSKQNEITQTESIFQNMPVPDSASGQSFSVIVGFQLTDDQLAYNQSMDKAAKPAP